MKSKVGLFLLRLNWYILCFFVVLQIGYMSTLIVTGNWRQLRPGMVLLDSLGVGWLVWRRPELFGSDDES